MNFLLERPTECSLRLVREFYENWDLWDKDSKVKIKGRVVTFTAHTMNVLVGTLEVDDDPLNLMNIKLPYAHI